MADSRDGTTLVTTSAVFCLDVLLCRPNTLRRVVGRAASFCWGLGVLFAFAACINRKEGWLLEF
jgi:hypothetical protein